MGKGDGAWVPPLRPVPSPFPAGEQNEDDMNDSNPDEAARPVPNPEHLLAAAQALAQMSKQLGRVQARCTELVEENRRLTAQLENVLDEHPDGAWQARALDAERERDEARAYAEKLTRECGAARDEAAEARAECASETRWATQYCREARAAEQECDRLQQQRDEARADAMQYAASVGKLAAECDRMRAVVM